MGRVKPGNEKDGKCRFVPPKVVMSNTENEQNLDAAIPIFSKWAKYDNHGEGGPKHVAGKIT